MSYKTKAELKDEILEVVADADEPLTASAISEEVGYSKLTSRVADALAELVTDGELETGVKDSVTTYAIADGEDDYDDENVEEDVEEEEEDEEDVEEEPEIVDLTYSNVTLPENSNGYEVSPLPNGHIKVTLPPGEDGEVKDVILEPGERLLVISDKYRFVVSQPEHVLEAIHTYTLEQGITTYLVTDMSTGQKIPDVADLNMDVAIIFIQISRHNKAGL